MGIFKKYRVFVQTLDRRTVTNIATAYDEGGLEAALYDEERSGRPIDFDDRERSRIIAMVCSEPPSGRYRWTLDLIAEESEKRKLIESSISREQVRIILQVKCSPCRYLSTKLSR